MITEFSIELATDLYNSQSDFPVDLDLAWQWLGYNQKSDCLEKIQNNFEIDLDYVRQTPELGSLVVPRPKHKYYLTVDCFKSLGMMVGTQQGKLIRKYFLQCEKSLKDLQTNSTVDYQKKLSIVSFTIDLAFKNLPVNPNIIAQQKINAAIKLDPSLQPLLSESLKLLVDSTSQQKQLLNPTQLGKLLNPPQSAKSVNLLLLDKGLQYKNTTKSSSKESDYLPTELAKDYYELTLDGSNGTTYQQLKWYESVIDLLR